MDPDKQATAGAEPVNTAATKVDDTGLHVVQRGAHVSGSDIDEDSIEGFDADRMKARTLLTADEEKKLLRKIDWHIMPLCSLMFLFKVYHTLVLDSARALTIPEHGRR